MRGLDQAHVPLVDPAWLNVAIPVPPLDHRAALLVLAPLLLAPDDRGGHDRQAASHRRDVRARRQSIHRASSHPGYGKDAAAEEGLTLRQPRTLPQRPQRAPGKLPPPNPRLGASVARRSGQSAQGRYRPEVLGYEPSERR